MSVKDNESELQQLKNDYNDFCDKVEKMGLPLIKTIRMIIEAYQIYVAAVTQIDGQIHEKYKAAGLNDSEIVVLTDAVYKSVLSNINTGGNS